MTVRELISQLQKLDPDTEVQAIAVPETYLNELRDTDEPIIETMKSKKTGDYVVIRA